MHNNFLDQSRLNLNLSMGNSRRLSLDGSVASFMSPSN
jgi:hypothetical protein